MPENARSNAIAIVGMAGRFPGARGLEHFWRNVREGVEVLEEFSDADLEAAGVDPAVRARPGYVRRGSPLAEADHFDAPFFGFSPREAQILDPQHRVFLETAWEALEHAGHVADAAGQAVGVFAGVGMNTYLVAHLLRNPAFLASAGGYQIMVGNDKDFLATRASYKLDLRGPSVTVQTACSTSLVAVALACQALQRGECDLALAGGVAILFPQRAGYLHEEGMILSPDGHCRPFDAAARGTRGSSGAGVVVLKRLGDAVADRDTIHAVILGAAVNNDGAAKAGYTAPSIEGQVEAIATAQALAGVDPRTIGYLEAHGTGTPLGDPIEIAALTQVFRAATPDVGFCRLGSLKASIGHLDAAAGVGGLIKAALALSHRELPPLVNFTRANPQLALETSPFVASAAAAPWPAADGARRRAGVSSFGIGGTNAHAVLEEAPPVERRADLRDAHLLVVSARTATALDRATADLAAHLEAHPEQPLGDVSWTLQAGRRAFPHRRAVVVRDRAEAVERLRRPEQAPVLAAVQEGERRPVAFLFSGQGSQHVGMGAGLHRSEPVYREAFDRCAELLKPILGVDPRELVFGSAESRAIDETRHTQPLLFATEYALACLWRSLGVEPAAMVGHSIGEYVAAHLAGVLSLEDALAVVAARGRLMQACAPGTMAAVHLSAAELVPRLAAAPGVEVAARNAPGLTTVSGPADAVAALLARLAAAGVDARPLHTSHAFHSAMMEPALDPFRALLGEVKLAAPRIPYTSNLSGTWITPAEATSPDYYARHLRHAVRFEECVRTLAADPATLLLEVGPGNALASLARITVGKDGSRRVIASLGHPRERRPDAEAVREAAGRLWLAGAALDWKGLHAGEAPRRVPLPTYPFERKRHMVDPAPAAPGVGQAADPLGVTADVGRWLQAPTWARDDAPAPAPQLAGAWLVLAGPGPLGEAVARRLRSAGADPIVVEPGAQRERLEASRFRARPGAAGDLAGIAQEARPGARLAGAIHLWTAAEGPAAGGASPAALAYHALVALAEVLAPAPGGAPATLIAATAGAESVLDEPVRHPEAALAAGPARSLPLEIPGLQARLVDLDPARLADADATAAAVVGEAARTDAERVVAHRGGRRFVRRFERIPAPSAAAATLPLKRGGAYLITGGLGGIGLTLARWIAAQGPARLLLTARTVPPARDAWDAWLAGHAADDRIAVAIRELRAIEAAGSEVLVASADAADEVAMGRALDLARARWGELDGVIHAAGISGNNRVAFRKTPEDVAGVLAPKVDGLAVLVRLLGDRPLDFVVLLGSISSVLGGAGVCDYAAANAVLDAFVDSTVRPRSWRRVATFSFGAWRDVGMAARVEVAESRRKAWEEYLRSAIAPAAGAEAFARALATGRSRVVIAPFDVSRAAEAIAAPPARQAEQAEAGGAASNAGGQLPQESPEAGAGGAAGGPERSRPFRAPSTEVERQLAAIWTELLGVERIGLDDDFFELGGHSLLGTRVLARVEQALHARLTLRDVFDAPTLGRLADKVSAATGGGAGSPGDPQGDREEMEF